MWKKIVISLLLVLLIIAVTKGLFFSGNTQPYEKGTFFYKAKEPGYVWASAGTQYKLGKIGEFWLGKHYRDVWAVPIKAPILNITNIFGGLQVGKQGGGMQTISINLLGKKGRTYVLRSLDKDPINVLPPFWQRTIAADLVRDQISASNPYAALVVAPLAQAANIYHTNPRIVFVSGSDVNFKKHHKLIKNKLFLLEEKYSAPQSFASATTDTGLLDIVNSVEMLDKRFRYSQHQINQLGYAKSRLFDILLSDWDRHEGQWNWAAFQRGTNVVYVPVPKDRDQAFSKYHDGLIPWLLTRRFALRKMGNFDEKISDVYAYTVNAAFLDERALNGVTLPMLKKVAQQLQLALTDQVIEEAVKNFPAPVFNLVGQETTRKLKARRDQLVEVAERYYKLLAEHVVVAGSDEQEKFVVKRLNNDQTAITIYQVDNRQKIIKPLYHRVFQTNETKSITLHGLAGRDIFEVSGRVAVGIKINLVGGPGEDTFGDVSEVIQEKGKCLIYDTKKGNKIKWGKQTVDKTTKDIAVHLYDREGF
ncbi:hypothetical protein [Adhaeribacter aquaticus]|uniref:hypothetical protein n=1 Tax=Adhaeribacter aquaticus TaxID=299567 RepID=UPI0004118797|nr:hypothetical protein [Adhaeribacter aquaticus]